MIRSVAIVILIAAFAAPAYAKGGGSDIQHEREKLQAESEKARGKKASTSPSIFDLIFGEDKKSGQASK